MDNNWRTNRRRVHTTAEMLYPLSARTVRHPSELLLFVALRPSVEMEMLLCLVFARFQPFPFAVVVIGLTISFLPFKNFYSD
jgi:hypothetical protein